MQMIKDTTRRTAKTDSRIQSKKAIKDTEAVVVARLSPFCGFGLGGAVWPLVFRLGQPL